MRKDKEKAIALRRSGKSYKQIYRELGIATSTLAGWFKNEPWSQEIKDRLSKEVSLTNPLVLSLMVRANKERWKIKHEEYQTNAIKEFSKLKNDPLFITGLMLYWGEGDKSRDNGIVRLTNSEPEMIKIFWMFLHRTLSIPQNKITARLILYPDLPDEPQRRLWSKLINLPLERFRKSTYIRSRHPARRLSYGVCNIDVYSTELKEKIFKWLELYRQRLINSV